MKWHLFIPLFFFTTLGSLAQEPVLIHNQALLFQLPSGSDTIEFIVVDTVLQEKKPVFLWSQGSLPQPLFGEVRPGKYHFQGGGIANFDYQKIVKDFHLVVIAMPKTPVTVSKQNLNKQFQYVPDTAKPYDFLEDYIKADFLDNYVNRGEKVLRFLAEQEWVDNSGIILAGASQGTKVATKLAGKFNNVEALGLFSPNPFGRIDAFVRKARLDAHLGVITWEEADKEIEEWYEFYRKSFNPDSIKQKPFLKAWNSFSEPYLDDWLTLDSPIYIAYGTEDRTSDLCDLLPLFFYSGR